MGGGYWEKLFVFLKEYIIESKSCRMLTKDKELLSTLCRFLQLFRCVYRPGYQLVSEIRVFIPLNQAETLCEQI